MNYDMFRCITHMILGFVCLCIFCVYANPVYGLVAILFQGLAIHDRKLFEKQLKT